MPNLLESIMGQMQRTRLSRNSHAPMPEIIEPGEWQVHGSARGHGMVDKTHRVMVAPDDASPRSRRTRLHELTHTAISPAADYAKEAEEVGAHLLVLQGCEDTRVNGFMQGDEVLADHLNHPEAAVFDERGKKSLRAAVERVRDALTTEDKQAELRLVGSALAMASSHTPDEAFTDELAEMMGSPMDTIRKAREMIDADPSWETVKQASALVTEKAIFGEEEEPECKQPGEGDEPIEEETSTRMVGEVLEGTLAEGVGVEGESGDGDDDEGGDSNPGQGGVEANKMSPTHEGDGKAPKVEAAKSEVTETKRKEETGRDPEELKSELKKIGDEWIEWAATQTGEAGMKMIREVKDARKYLHSGSSKGGTISPTENGSERVFTNPLAELRAIGRTTGGHTTRYGPMEIIRPKLVEPMKKIRKAMPDKTWTATDESGRLNRRVARLHTDGMVLRRKRRGPKPKRKGAILIDASGSMGLNHGHLERILAVVPFSTVAFYSSAPGSNASGVLYVIAEKGKCVANIAAECPKGGGNVVDGPALEWLAKQKGPRVWVSDGWVTGINETQAPNIYNEAADICERHDIIRVPTLEMLLADREFNYKIVM